MARTRKRPLHTSAKLLLPSGYLNWDYIMSRPEPFILVVGGRGTGKTYGALKWHYEHKRYFIFTRRTAAQIKTLMNPKLNPFKRLNADLHINIQCYTIAGDVHAFAPMEEVPARNKRPAPSGDDIATVVPLSTFANTRGFDASEAESWIVDEVNPEQNERPLQNECDVYLNAYETMCRNRELEGAPPVKGIFMSNSNTLKNPLLIGLELVTVLRKMERDGMSELSIPDRGLYIIKLKDSPISAAKADTALYRLAKGTRFSKMALDNEFADDRESGSIRLCDVTVVRQYTPYVVIGELYIYKNNAPDKRLKEWYISYTIKHKLPATPIFPPDTTSTARFIKQYRTLWEAYMYNHVLFEDYFAELLFQKYFGK